MPTVPVYNRQVQQQTLPSFRVQQTASAETFGGGLGQTISNIGEEAFKMQQQKQAKINQIAVANAMSNTQKELIPVQNDMLTKMGTNALGTAETKDNPATPGISQSFLTKSNDIYKKTLDSLSNDTQKTHYQQWYDSMNPSMYQSVVNHEKKQVEVAHTAANESQLNANSEAFSSAVLMGNYAQANNSLRSGIGLSDSMGSINGVPSETQEENHKKYVYGNIGKTVDILLANNRPEDAKKMIDYYGDKLPESQKAINMSKISPALEKNETFTYVNSLTNDATMRNADGTLNSAKMLEAAEAKYTSRTRTVVKEGTPGSGVDYESFKTALFGQESGGNYEAKNERTGAYGKYQIIPENWPSWAKDAGLSADAPQTPANQELVVNAKLKPLYEKYGARGAAISWYGGEGALNYSEEAKNRKQGAGDEPSINEYADSILSKMGGTPGTPSTIEQVSAPDLIGLQLARAQIMQAASESNAKHKQDIDNNMYQFDQWLTTNKPTTIAAIQSQAQSMGFQGPDLINAIAKGKQFAGLLKVEENENSVALFEEALGKMYRGEITTKGELDSQYGGSLPYSKLITLGNSLKRETKWATTENLSAFRGVIEDKRIKGSEKSLIYEKISQQAAVSFAKGIDPTPSDIRDWAEEQTQKVIIGRKWYGGANKIDTAFVPSSWSITADGVYTPEGIKISKSENGKFYTNVNGVDIEVQP
jgi:hypothetical protein